MGNTNYDLGSLDTWSKALEAKNLCDAELRDLTTQVNRARTMAVQQRERAAACWYREIDSKIAVLKSRSQTLQVLLSKLRAQEKKDNIEYSKTHLRAFERAAYELLDKDTFYRVTERASYWIDHWDEKQPRERA
jgi:hypothetical protein